MDKIKRILMMFFVFFYLISFVYAQDYSLFSGRFYDLNNGEEEIEFEFYNGTYSICENGEKTIPILVVNKDAKEDNKIYLDAAGAGWASLNVKEFSLPKKQSGVVFLNLNPWKDSNGNYKVKVNGFSSVGNIKRDLILDVNVEKCYSLKLEIEKEYDKVCGGIKKQYGGEIINDGKQKSDVEISVKGPNWISVDEDIFSVDANDKEKFELILDIPANAKGVFDIFISATAKNLPSIKSEKKLKVEVVPEYDCFKADVMADAKIANLYSKEHIPIKIKNIGIKQAVYDVSLDAPKWISIEPKKLTVNPGQTGNLNLNINPDANVSEGNYLAKIKVNFGDILYSKNIDVVLSRENQFWKSSKSFFVFYQYYIYVSLLILIVLLIFRRKISTKIKISYKNYKFRRARLRALEAARKTRQLKIKKIKKEVRETKKAGFKLRKIKKYKRLILFFIALMIVVMLLIFSIYQYNFPASKKLIKTYYAYFIAGILIALFVIFIIEFYKPLFKLLKKIK